MNVSDPLRRHAERTPHADAFVRVDGIAITYALLERTINSVAQRLRFMGLAPGQVAVLATQDLYKYTVVALALARIGVAHAPASLPTHLADVSIVDGAAPAEVGGRTLALDEVLSAGVPLPDDVEPVASHADGAAVLMHCPTSGTTGERKFVPISHELSLRRVMHRVPARATADGGGTAALRQACLIGPGSSYGFSSILLVLHGGGAVIEPCTDAGRFAQWLVASRVNSIIAAPFVLKKIIDALPALQPPATLASIEVGGGALPAPLHALISRHLCPDIVIGYGLTECGRVAEASAATTMGKPGAVGFARPGVEVEIVDDDDRPIAAGHEGILRIRSDRNASGYLDNPEASAAVFRGGWVYPGDRGQLDADGMLRIVGRTDDVINRGGDRISPQPIEDALMALGGLREVAVFGVPGAGFTSVCAAIVPTVPVDANVFHARCREQLGAHAPEYIMHMRALPRNANGKVLRGELVRIAIEANRGIPRRG